MIDLSMNGVNATLMEEKDFDWKLSAYFATAFDNYLKANYGITEGQFKEIIKNIAPEEFI